MAKKQVKRSHFSLKYLELLGKPILFLFTFLGVLTLALVHLITNFHLPPPSLPHLPRPKLSLPFPRVSLPTFRQVFLFLSPTLILATLLVLYYVYILRDLPDIHTLTTTTPNLSTKIYDRRGELLYKIYGTENRTLIKLDDLPLHLISATIAAEDKDFYRHHGISLSGIARAIRHNISCFGFRNSCSSIQGGSTITQQLIKNTLLTPEKTLTRKLKEIVLSLRAESAFSKTQILELYLNNIPYGGTSYGVEEASQEYFGKSARDLDLGEAALIAGLPVAPTSLSPFGSTPYMAKIRQRQVLESMVLEGYISENEKVAALSAPVAFHPRMIEIKAPHFVMHVKSLLVKEFGEQMVERGGLEVVTTLDLTVQNELQTQINSELAKLEKLKVGNGAGMVVSPNSGEILAMVGSRNFFNTEEDGQVNIVFQERQPGSAIKPLTYALAFMSGATPETLIEDSPICFLSQGSKPYCPVNYDGRFHGQITLKTALGSSYNIPAIKLLNSLGVGNLITLGKSMGITTWDDSRRFGLALTLGGGEITMYDLVQVYSVFASGGEKIPLNSISSVRGADSTLLAYPHPSPPKLVIPPQVASQISTILADRQARAPAFGQNTILNLPGRGVSVKTGTTNNLRDNWTIGYTKDLLVATWVGNNDNSPMSSVASGVTGASPIWAHTMKNLLGKPDRTTLVQENLPSSL